jgi:sugar/nucleoside kinase (ribokinase family)
VSGQIVVAGNLTIDDTVNPGAVLDAAPGGDALYAAMGVRTWGRTPTLLTLVGEDYPAPHLERIRAAGIDVTHVRAVPGPTIHYRITNAPSGERIYEWVGDPDRLEATSPEASDYSALEGAAWLHIAAMPIAAQTVAVEAARRAGVPYSLDPHEEYVIGDERVVRALVRGAAFMPSELEVRLLFPDLLGLEPLACAQAAVERLDAWEPAFVAVKVGELGAYVRVDGRDVHVPAATIDVVDSTGAGDAFCGGFVSGWLATGSARVAAACGAVSAAGVMGAFGAFAEGPQPSLDDHIDQVLAIAGAATGDRAAGLPTDIRARLRSAADAAA